VSFAKVTIIGNLGRDPERRFTASGTNSLEFSVAVSRKWTDRAGQRQESTTWFRVTAWGRLADTLTSLEGLRKGAQVYCEGRIEQREYTANDGTQRTSLDVTANEVQLLGSRERSPYDVTETMQEVTW
jgi:single-strand DNA-binding protein